MINIEILSSYLDTLGLSQSTTICVNGELAIDNCIRIIEESLALPHGVGAVV